MAGRLEGKVCVITGTASGIGAESARLFQSEGAQVVGVDLSPDAVGDLASQADVTKPEDVDAAELLGRSLVHATYLLLVRHVGFERELSLRAGVDVHTHYLRPLLREQARRLRTDAARGPRDHTYLPVEPSGHQVSPVA